MPANIVPIIIIAPWSSGSTALTGFLTACGAHSCPPYQRTNDPKTPVAYEPLAYASALRALIDERSLAPIGYIQDFKIFFDNFWAKECCNAARLGLAHIILKHPLQTFLLPMLDKKLSPKYIVLTRPLSKIEATRRRRKWASNYGSAGAEKIYSTAFSFLIKNSRDFLAISYESLLESSAGRAKLIEYCNLEPTQAMLEEAEKFVSR